MFCSAPAHSFDNTSLLRFWKYNTLSLMNKTAIVIAVILCVTAIIIALVIFAPAIAEPIIYTIIGAIIVLAGSRMIKD